MIKEQIFYVIKQGEKYLCHVDGGFCTWDKDGLWPYPTLKYPTLEEAIECLENISFYSPEHNNADNALIVKQLVTTTEALAYLVDP